MERALHPARSTDPFPRVRGESARAAEQKATLEAKLWIINDWRKLPKVLGAAPLPEVFNTRLRFGFCCFWLFFLNKKCSSSARAAGLGSAQGNPTVKSWLGWASTPNKTQISTHLFSTPLENAKKLQAECISIKKCCGWWCTEPGNVFAAATRAVVSFFLKFLLLQLCFFQRVRDQSWSSLSDKDH